MAIVFFNFLMLTINSYLRGLYFKDNSMGEVNFYRVRCYEKLGEHADYVFSVKQKPKKFKRLDDFTS